MRHRDRFTRNAQMHSSSPWRRCHRAKSAQTTRPGDCYGQDDDQAIKTRRRPTSRVRQSLPCRVLNLHGVSNYCTRGEENMTKTSIILSPHRDCTRPRILHLLPSEVLHAQALAYPLDRLAGVFGGARSLFWPADGRSSGRRFLTRSLPLRFGHCEIASRFR